MTTQDGKGEPQEHRDFFISYTSNDLQWAKWIANQLNDAGYTYILDKRDFQPGSHFLTEMNNATQSCDRTLVVLSPDYLQSEFATLEWKASMLKDPTGARRCLLPVRVKDFRVDGLLATITHIDLVSCDEDEAKKRLLEGVHPESAKQEKEVPYPGPQSHTPVPFPGSLPAHWNIPYERNPFFTGREKQLVQLHEQLQTTQATAINQSQAISGLGGIGKTQLAVEYAYRYRGEYQAVLWARAESVEALTASFIDIAHLLELPEKDEQEPLMMVEAVKRWLQRQPGWLLILDNADSPDLLPAFLPRTICGHLLLTTRAAEVNTHLIGFAHPLEVKSFSDEQGALFLLHRSGLLPLDAILDHAETDTRHLALAITQELGGLPLALDQAGAYLKATGCSLVVYHRTYQERHALLLNERRGAAHPEPVATTWNLSFQNINQQNPAAADLLRFCAFLAPDSIPEEIVTAGAQELGFLLSPVAADAYLLNQAIEVLHAYSLITRDPQDQILTIHRLVQAVLKEQMDKQNRQQWAERTVRAVKAALPQPPVKPANWPHWERIMPHAQLCALYIEKYDMQFTEATDLLSKTGLYLTERAQYETAAALLLDGLNIVKKSQHPDLDSFLKKTIYLRYLGNVYSETGEYAKAENLYKESLDIFELNKDLDRRQFARLLNNLAIIFKVRGKPEEATKMFYTHALDTQVQNLATFFEVREKPEDLIKLYIRCLLNEKTEVHKFAQVLNNLAVLYAEQPVKYGTAGQRLRKYETAERLFHLSLWLQKQHLEHDTPEMENDPGCYDSDYALSLNDLANLYTEWGSNPEVPPEMRCTLYEMAASLYRDSMDILENRHNGVNHPDIAYPFHGQGILDFEQGRYEEAEEGYQKSLDIWEKYLQPGHPQIAYALYNLANLYFEQGKQAEAESQRQRHFYAMAEERYEKSLGIWKERLGRWHLHTRTCAKKYVKLLRILNKDAKAQRIEKDFGV